MLVALCLLTLALLDCVDRARTVAEPSDLVARAGCVRAYHRPAPERFAMGGPRLEFQLCRDHTQEHLRADYTVRVWVAGTAQLVAELPMPLVVTILTQFVASAGMTASFLALADSPRRPPASAPPRSAPPPVGVPPSALQAARRAARRSRVGRAGRPPQMKE